MASITIQNYEYIDVLSRKLSKARYEPNFIRWKTLLKESH
jgi:hypothetical protein